LDGDEDPERARTLLSNLHLPGTLVDGYARGRAGAEAVAAP
jgi:hypothetical protein